MKPRRGWILKAFIMGGFSHNWPDAVEWYQNVLHVIERGRKVWRNVPRKDRGEVFEDGFYLAVRGHHLEAYFQACARPREFHKNSNINLEKLLELAQGIYRDSKKWKQNPDDYLEDIGYMYGYFVYPRAESLG